MQGVSRASLEAQRESLRRRSADAGLLELSDELYAVTGVLAANYGLRRSLSDPSVDAGAKANAAAMLFRDRVSDAALEVTRQVVRAHWSQPRDLVDAIETLAADAALIAAEAAGQLDEVEDELFRFSRILSGEPRLRAALADIGLPAEAKRELLDRLLTGKTADVTRKLLVQAVVAPRGRTIERAIADLSALAASRRDRLIARVTSASELSADEQTKIAAALATALGNEVYLQVVVDPELIGGLSVRIGDEVIDASVARQLDEARRRLTGRTTVRRT